MINLAKANTVYKFVQYVCAVRTHSMYVNIS